MSIFEKAYWHTDDDKVTLSVPISKIDRENRIVSGFATLDNIDRQGDVVTLDASIKAFESFRGNVREMHQPIAVGKMVSFDTKKYYDNNDKKEYNGVFVRSYISKGAQDTWEKILDGTLTGFSIGGSIKKTETAYNSDLDKNIRIVNEYELQELSLVDNPANQHANILSIQKNDNGEILLKGIATETNFNNVFLCSDDNLVIFSATDDSQCPGCEKRMINIGFIESIEKDKGSIAKSLINKYMTSFNEKKDIFKIGDFVSWSSDIEKAGTLFDEILIDEEDVEEFFEKAAKVSVGDHVLYAVPKPPEGTKYGHGLVTRVVTSGSVRVSGTNESVEASSDNPVAVIRVWAVTDEGYKETDREVARPVSTLRISEERLEKASSKVMATLKQKADSHNEDVGNAAGKRTNVRTLAAVFDRGVGAYRTNPGSVRPNVTSEEQWAYARVNGFLRALRTGRFPRSPYDTDLLPEQHPLSSKMKKDLDMLDDEGQFTGRVIRIVKNGFLTIPDNSSIISASESDPAVLITVYSKTSEGFQETDKVVGHKMSILKHTIPIIKNNEFDQNVDEFVNTKEVEMANEDIEKLDNEEVESAEIVKNNEEVDEESVETTDNEEAEVEHEEVVEVVEKTFDDVQKSVDDIAAEIASSLKNVFKEEVRSYTDALIKSIQESIEKINEKISDIEKSTSTTVESLGKVESTVEKFEQRVQAVESDTAVRKSGDLGGVVQEQKIRKTLWDGRFLGSADLYR